MKVFKGGIQPGTVACDAEARLLDEQCKGSMNSVLVELESRFGLDVRVQAKLRQDQIPGGVGACAPDGGAWFFRGRLIAVFEAKKQNDRGNAIERWFKNNYICRKINPEVSYVTFASGEGATARGTIGKALSVAHLAGFNQYNPGDNSCYLNTQGFTQQEIQTRMIEIIAERIQELTV